MKELAYEACAAYDMVIFDTPPILAVADAQILGNVADGSVLVISSGKTEKEQAAKAKRGACNVQKQAPWGDYERQKAFEAL